MPPGITATNGPKCSKRTFKEKGIFDRETAASFRENILSKGNSEHPMELYVRFRGHKPDTQALFDKMGIK